MPPRRDEAAIFNVARRMESPEARRSYLYVACGDDAELRRRIDSLLRIHEEDQSFLTLPTLVQVMRDDLSRAATERAAAEEAAPPGPAEPVPSRNRLALLLRAIRRLLP